MQGLRQEQPGCDARAPCDRLLYDALPARLPAAGCFCQTRVVAPGSLKSCLRSRQPPSRAGGGVGCHGKQRLGAVHRAGQVAGVCGSGRCGWGVEQHTIKSTALQ